ncbi:MAG: hypothetical protein ACLTFB_01335 [Candidatus Phytoplasma pyri]
MNLIDKNRLKYIIIYFLFLIIFLFFNYSIKLLAILPEEIKQQRLEQETEFNNRLINEPDSFGNIIPKINNIDDNNNSNIKLITEKIKQQRLEQETEFNERKKYFHEDYDHKFYLELLENKKLLELLENKTFQKLLKLLKDKAEISKEDKKLFPKFLKLLEDEKFLDLLKKYDDKLYLELLENKIPSKFNHIRKINNFINYTLSYGGYGCYNYNLHPKQKYNTSLQNLSNEYQILIDQNNLQRTQIFSQTPRLANQQFRIEKLNEYYKDILVPLVRENKKNTEFFFNIINKLSNSLTPNNNIYNNLEIPSLLLNAEVIFSRNSSNKTNIKSSDNDFDIKKLDLLSLIKYISKQSDAKFSEEIERIRTKIDSSFFISYYSFNSFLFSVDRNQPLEQQLKDYLKLINNPIKNKDTLIHNLENKNNNYYSQICQQNEELDSFLTESTQETNKFNEPTLYSFYHRWHNKNYTLESDLSLQNNINEEIKNDLNVLIKDFLQEYSKIFKEFQDNLKWIQLDLKRQKNKILHQDNFNSKQISNLNFLQDKNELINELEYDISNIENKIEKEIIVLQGQYQKIDDKIRKFMQFLNTSVPNNSIQPQFNEIMNSCINKTQSLIKNNLKFENEIKEKIELEENIKPKIQQNIDKLKNYNNNISEFTIISLIQLLKPNSDKLLELLTTNINEINKLIAKFNNDSETKIPELEDHQQIFDIFKNIDWKQHFLYHKINASGNYYLIQQFINKLITKYEDIISDIEKNQNIISTRQSEIKSLEEIIKEQSSILFNNKILNREQALNDFKCVFENKYEEIQTKFNSSLFNLDTFKQEINKINKKINDQYEQYELQLNKIIQEQLPKIKELIQEQFKNEQELKKFFDNIFFEIQQKKYNLFLRKNLQISSNQHDIIKSKQQIETIQNDINSIKTRIQDNITNNTIQPLRHFIETKYSSLNDDIGQLCVGDVNIISSQENILINTAGNNKYLYV